MASASLLRAASSARRLAAASLSTTGGGAAAARRLFTPDGHCQVDVRLEPHAPPGGGPAVERALLTLSPTDALLDALDGEVVGSSAAARVGEAVGAGAGLVELEWEGVRMGAADELYHSKFEQATGRYALRAPVSGSVVAFNDAALGDGLARPTWLVRMVASEPSQLRALLEHPVPAAA